jgi:hypothetical protein
VTGYYTDRQVPAADPGHALVITADGKGIPVRPEALRAGTARLAAKAKQAPPGAHQRERRRQGQQQADGRRIVAELVCVYDLEPVPRTVEDILPALPAGDGDGDGDDRADGAAGADGSGDDLQARAPKAAGTWLTASVTDDIAAVIAAGFDEATTRSVKVTVLIDWLHVAGCHGGRLLRSGRQVRGRGGRRTVLRLTRTGPPPAPPVPSPTSTPTIWSEESTP